MVYSACIQHTCANSTRQTTLSHNPNPAQVVPAMSELGLLRDSLAALDQPFLAVVVGEFNSGKSSVINALLGKKWLEEGILPTTNEISLLKHLDESEDQVGVEEHTKSEGQ